MATAGGTDGPRPSGSGASRVGAGADGERSVVGRTIPLPRRRRRREPSTKCDARARRSSPHLSGVMCGHSRWSVSVPHTSLFTADGFFGWCIGDTFVCRYQERRRNSCSLRAAEEKGLRHMSDLCVFRNTRRILRSMETSTVRCSPGAFHEHGRNVMLNKISIERHSLALASPGTVLHLQGLASESK